MIKLTKNEGFVILVIVIALIGGIVNYIQRSKQSEQKAPIEKVAEPLDWGEIEQEYGEWPKEEYGFLPPIRLNIPFSEDPTLTWDEIDECVQYLDLTTQLVKGKKETACSGNTAYLLVSNTQKSATTLYNRWIMGTKREGYSLKEDNRELSVFVLEENSHVARSHHCTSFGKH